MISQNDQSFRNSMHTTIDYLKSTIHLSSVYIYGMACEKNRQSVFYIHHYHKNDSIDPFSINEKKKFSGKNLDYAAKTLLPLQENHQNCKRQFFFFTGKFGIISEPSTKIQRHYDFHQNRISAAAVHPKKTLICTGEVAYKNP